MAEAEQAPMRMRIDKIYLKDASFESPASPQIFVSTWQPELKLDVNTRVTPLEGNLHEVVLTVTATALQEDKPGFIAEEQQAGIFLIEGGDAAQLAQVLGIACPTTLFPYAREAADALVVKGGFPPLQLAPINFESLYMQARENQAAEPNPEEGGSEPGSDPSRVTH